MNPEPVRQKLTDYILSGHAYLHCRTTETTRFLGELKVLADALPDDGRQVFTWSQAAGWRDADDNPPQGVQFGQRPRTTRHQHIVTVRCVRHVIPSA